MNIVQQYISGNYNYIDVAANDIDYAVINRGENALNELCINGCTILDSSQNYTHPGVLQAIANSMDYCKIPGVVLGSDPAINTDRIKYFPYFALYGINAWQHKQPSGTPAYLYSCLNRNPHMHRIQNWFVLKDIPGGIWSMHNLKGYVLGDHPIELGKAIKFWQENCQQFPSECENDLTVDHPAYSSSYINLVTETVMSQTVFVSEKTWKPIANAQLFLIAGCAGTVAYLRSIGVDVFDDFIDHSYDNEPKWINRLVKVQNSFKQLISKDIPTIWKQTADRRIQNTQKFFDKTFVNMHIDQVGVDT